MSVRMENVGEMVTAYLDGEIDHHSAGEIREQIDSMITRAAPSLVVLDFRDVSFMDSSGIGVIVGRYKTLSAIGGKTVIAAPPPQIARIINLSGMQKLIPVWSTVDAAIIGANK